MCENNEVCVICYEDRSLNEFVKLLICGHQFCYECSQSLLHTTEKCPLDNSEIQSILFINQSETNPFYVAYQQKIYSNILKISNKLTVLTCREIMKLIKFVEFKNKNLEIPQIRKYYEDEEYFKQNINELWDKLTRIPYFLSFDIKNSFSNRVNEIKFNHNFQYDKFDGFLNDDLRFKINKRREKDNLLYNYFVSLSEICKSELKMYDFIYGLVINYRNNSIDSTNLFQTLKLLINNILVIKAKKLNFLNIGKALLLHFIKFLNKKKYIPFIQTIDYSYQPRYSFGEEIIGKQCKMCTSCEELHLRTKWNYFFDKNKPCRPIKSLEELKENTKEQLINDENYLQQIKMSLITSNLISIESALDSLLVLLHVIKTTNSDEVYYNHEFKMNAVTVTSIANLTHAQFMSSYNQTLHFLYPSDKIYSMYESISISNSAVASMIQIFIFTKPRAYKYAGIDVVREMNSKLEEILKGLLEMFNNLPNDYKRTRAIVEKLKQCLLLVLI